MDYKNGEFSPKQSTIPKHMGGIMGNEKQPTPSDHEALVKAQAHVWNHMFSFINSMSLKCAVELAIPDTIRDHGKPMTPSELVAKLPIHPSKAEHVHRLMRILSHSGFFAQDQEGYVLTQASTLLLRDSPFSVAPLVLIVLDPCLTKPWQCMTSWFRNDDPTPFDTAHGTPLWDYGAQDPSFSSSFNQCMASDTKLVTSIVTSTCKYVFQGFKTLIDVGGGTGTLAKGIAGAFPDMECVVFDLPHVVEGLEGTKNLKFVGGDMFQVIPPGDVVLLKWILHDWSDEECVKILEQCKEAIVSNGGEGGKVVIIEMVVQDRNRDKDSIETQLFFDLEIMALLTGKERNEEDWAQLFTRSGFREYKISPILGLRSLIEVYP